MNETNENRYLGIVSIIIAAFVLPLLIAVLAASWGLAFMAWQWAAKVLLGG